MIALVLLFLCLGGIVGHRWDNLFLKPLMGLVGEDITTAISRQKFNELQYPDDNPLATELDKNDGDGQDDNESESSSVTQHQGVSKRNLLQHLYADYGYLRSVEGWTKLKQNADFDMLMHRRFDCKRFVPGIYELLNEITSETSGHIHSLSTDGRKITLTIGNDKTASNNKGIRDLLPVSYYEDFSKDLQIDTHLKEIKRAGTSPVIGCDCKAKIDLVDLGQQHYPRYVMNAVCETSYQSPNEYPQKCWRGTHCKPLEYKVKVLTPRTVLDREHNDPALAWLPDELRQNWKFKTINVAAGCFCAY
ncbi:uncharacterized protein Ptth [Eurosta solidaginis]|uniref:uncharacterized protein Ptth n=1 Tax=Eurosta solidaginis TaxID=178769 RepID=UPI0035306FA1